MIVLPIKKKEVEVYHKSLKMVDYNQILQA